MDLDVLAARIAEHPPAIVYTMPNFQNPTGICTSQAHRERLLALCEARRIPILEDGFEEEMKYFGRVVLPIKSMDRRQLVIYCGTFSKVLFPGARIGWVAAARPCVERLAALRRFAEIAPSMILQAAMHDFCERGYYDRHVSRMHRLFRRRMQVALRSLRQHVKPTWAEWDEPKGGYLIWLRLRSLWAGPTSVHPRLRRLCASRSRLSTSRRSRKAFVGWPERSRAHTRDTRTVRHSC
jgi:DNA-binding transcriptional MocR family regulator